MSRSSSFNPELVSDQDVMDLIQQEQTTTASPGDVGQPAAAAPRTFSPVGQQAQPLNALSIAQFAAPGGRFAGSLEKLGWTGGDPLIYETQYGGGESGTGQIDVPVGVTPEFQQFVQSRGITGSLEDFGFGDSQVTLLAGGQPVEQFRDKPSGFEKFMNTAADLGTAAVLSLATGGALAAAFGAAGVGASTAAALGKALAPSVVNLAQTGDFNVEQAARSVAATLIAPSIGTAVADQIATTAALDLNIDISKDVQRAIANSTASAVATVLQEGADSSDIGRNMIAGAVASLVNTILTSVGVDPTYAAGIGRAAGSYISTGSGVQAIVDGAVRSLTYEQQQQALQDERNARATERAYQDPSRALDVVTPGAAETGTIEASSAIQDSGVAQDAGIQPTAQQVPVTGAAEGAAQVSPADLQTAVTDPATKQAEQVAVTGTKDSEAVTAQDIVDVIRADQSTTSGAVDATTATDPSATQQVVTTGTADQTVGITDKDIIDAVRASADSTSAATGSDTAGQQQVTVTGTADETKATEDDTFSTTGVDGVGTGATTAVGTGGAEQRVDVTGQRQDTNQITDKDIFDLIATQNGSATQGDSGQRVDITGTRLDENREEPFVFIDDSSVVGQRTPGGGRFEVTGTGASNVAGDDVYSGRSDVYRIGKSATGGYQSIPVVRPRYAPEADPFFFNFTQTPTFDLPSAPNIDYGSGLQTVEVTGARVEEEDPFGGGGFVARDRDTTSRGTTGGTTTTTTAPATTTTTSVAPTDIFPTVRRPRPTPVSTVARLAAMDYPVGKTVGLGAFTPAGELEPGGSAKPRQSVWNEASLRLKDALGL